MLLKVAQRQRSKEAKKQASGLADYYDAAQAHGATGMVVRVTLRGLISAIMQNVGVQDMRLR